MNVSFPSLENKELPIFLDKKKIIEDVYSRKFDNFHLRWQQTNTNFVQCSNFWRTWHDFASVAIDILARKWVFAFFAFFCSFSSDSTSFLLSTFSFFIFKLLFYYKSFKSASVYFFKTFSLSFLFCPSLALSLRLSTFFFCLLSEVASIFRRLSTSFPHSVRIFINPHQIRRLALANIKRMFISNEDNNNNKKSGTR